MPAILQKFVSKEAALEAAILKLFGSQAVNIWRHSVRLEIGGKEKNLASFTRSAKWTLMLRTLEHVWLKIIWLKSSHNPVWYKRLFGRHLDKISQKERRNENAARLLSTVENGSKDVRILCFFGDKLSKKTHTLQGETSVTALKNIRFLEWLPLR